MSEGALYGITVWWRNEDGTYDFEQKIRDKQENINVETSYENYLKNVEDDEEY